MCEIFSADKIIGSILCEDSKKEIDINSLYVLEKKVRAKYPNILFSMREQDVYDALDTFPEVFSLKDNHIIVLSRQKHSKERVKSYFSSLVAPEIIKLICKFV